MSVFLLREGKNLKVFRLFLAIVLGHEREAEERGAVQPRRGRRHSLALASPRPRGGLFESHVPMRWRILRGHSWYHFWAIVVVTVLLPGDAISKAAAPLRVLLEAVVAAKGTALGHSAVVTDVGAVFDPRLGKSLLVEIGREIIFGIRRVANPDGIATPGLSGGR